MSRLQQGPAVRVPLVAKGWSLELPARRACLLVAWPCYRISRCPITRDITVRAYASLSRITGQDDDLTATIVYARNEHVTRRDAALEACIDVADPEILSALA